jgi:hypothetical protein
VRRLYLLRDMVHGGLGFTQPGHNRKASIDNVFLQLLERAEFHCNNLLNTARVIDLGVPTIVVNTESGYDPVLSEVIAFVNEQHKY